MENQTPGQVEDERSISPESILSIQDFLDWDGHEEDIPEVTELPRLDVSIATSYSPKHDESKIRFLQKCGVKVPEEWVNELTEKYSWDLSSSIYHAEIVTTTIIMEHMKDIFYFLRYGSISEFSEEISNELKFHAQWLINERVEKSGLRYYDVQGNSKNREMRIKNQGILCNARGQVSAMELRELVVLVLDSFKMREA